jgi:hypothetical protein
MDGLRRTVFVLGAAALLVVALGVGSASSGPKPIDVSIATKKDGTYRSNGLHTQQPDSNPQVVSKKIDAGKTAKFYVRFKNKNAGAIGTYMFGDKGEDGFVTTYSIGGDDVTADFYDCTFREVPANGKVLVLMKVKDVAGGSGASDDVGAGSVNGGSCGGGVSDLTWAKVKVK